MILTILSAGLLYFAFPNSFCPFGAGYFAWMFAVPLFFALENKPLKERFFVGLLWGAAFYGSVTRSMIPYNISGYLGFVGVLSIQPILFCLFYRPNERHLIHSVFFIPSLWVLTELARTLFLSGFSWGVGHSQSFNVCLLQIVKITGSYGLSFLLVLVNQCLYKIVKEPRSVKICLTVLVGFVGLSYAFGFSIVQSYDQKPLVNERLRVCAVQGNVDSYQKLEKENIPDFVAQYEWLTKKCLLQNPDLIVWPETAIPDEFRDNETLFSQVRNAVYSFHTPIVFGAALQEGEEEFNSAVLMDAQANIADIYHKRKLIPFSENPIVRDIPDGVRKLLSLPLFQFDPGRRPGIFSFVPRHADGTADSRKFGTAICSEDIYPAIFRELVSKGAEFIVLILNDGWFDYKEALILHTQNSIVRAAENGISVVRSANSGWTCLIDPLGRIMKGTTIPFQKSGFSVIELSLQKIPALYSQIGDFFAVVCAVFAIISMILPKIKRKETS